MIIVLKLHFIGCEDWLEHMHMQSVLQRSGAQGQGPPSDLYNGRYLMLSRVEWAESGASEDPRCLPSLCSSDCYMLLKHGGKRQRRGSDDGGR